MSSTDDAERKKKKEQLSAYVSSREVFSCAQYSILVDSFRFLRPYYNLLHERYCSGGSEQIGSLRESNNSSNGAAATPNVIYFLSHFHSDHYTGITPSWSNGRIFCSLPTAALVTSVLHVPVGLVYPLLFDTWYVFCMTRRCQTTTTASTGDGGGAGGGGVNCVLCMEEEKAYSALGEEEKHRYDVLFKVRLVDANHCPGAAMFLFTSDSFGCVLHTGDFRYNCADREQGARHLFADRPDFAPFYASQRLVREMAAVAARSESTDRKEVVGAALRAKLHTPFYERFLDTALTSFRGKIDTLFMDNTFCHPSFHFPKQWEVTQHVVDALRTIFVEEGERKKQAAAAAAAGQRGDPVCVTVALIVGAYAIGKERVAFAVQEAFDLDTACYTGCKKVPIYVPEKKMELFHDMRFYADRFRPARTPQLDGGTKGVRLDAFPVQLPLLASEALPTVSSSSTATPDPSVSRGLVYEDGVEDVSREKNSLTTSGGDITYKLTILLAPIGSVSYPTLAEAVGRPVKRRRGSDESSAHEEQQGVPLLHLDDNTGVDLSLYDQILAVEPTGWSKKCKTHRIPPRVQLLSIPYSEHSGFNELLQFVAFMNPSKVVPTVSVEQYAEQESLFVARAPRLKCRFGNTQPLSNFFTAQPVKQRLPPPPPLDRNAVAVKKESGAQQSGDGEGEVKDCHRAAVPTSSLTNRTGGENKPPPPAQRPQLPPPTKNNLVARTPLLTNYFTKAPRRDTANNSGSPAKKEKGEEKTNAKGLANDDVDDDDDCLYVGCGHEVNEISDDD